MQKNLRSLCSTIFLLLITIVPTFGTDAQPFSKEALSIGLPDKIGSEWKASASSHKLNADKLPIEAEIKLLLEYGLQSITSRPYTKGKDKVEISSFEMKYVSGAYGLWSFHRQSLPEGQREIFSGRYVIRISASTKATADELITQIQPNLLPSSDLPLLPTYLPEQNKLQASEIYIVGPEAITKIPALSNLKEAIDFTGGTHAATADYSNGGGRMSVILIEFQSPQFATDGLAKIQQHFNLLSPEEQKRRLLRRVGNYAVEAVNVIDQKAAEELIGQIKYMARVYWEGKGMASVPLQFRPPDPVSLQEAVQTGQFIVAAFYWIGILVVGAVLTGVLTGGAFFYWRRAQRRQFGGEDIFTDAGGMTRLNLDDYLLQPSSSQKLLGKKE